MTAPWWKTSFYCRLWELSTQPPGLALHYRFRLMSPDDSATEWILLHLEYYRYQYYAFCFIQLEALMPKATAGGKEETGWASTNAAHHYDNSWRDTTRPQALDFFAIFEVDLNLMKFGMLTLLTLPKLHLANILISFKLTYNWQGLCNKAQIMNFVTIFQVAVNPMKFGMPTLLM